MGYLKGGIGTWPEKLETVKSIHANQMSGEMKTGAEVLDVRKHGEWNTGHLKDAKFKPLSEFPKSIEKLDKTKPYIVHCGGGYRSMTAISIMKNHGFKNLINVYGGFGAMQNAGLEIVIPEEAEV